ncbi:CRISPR-associated protein Cas4 [Ferroglobus placidus DSM 10642]|uniref:CRISPR-associated exonuclease Cas4 n=1 Tax=Ferroglobus placidus (strain DSM 10642 / AEDII12DO) TaxID=589924 RepID=D3RZT7_FERPA|nr:CRISPR-associated protein Cas4 [Ferroglobus placidus]ADC66000.1 CRISPR-associated protein Cas4 [Ferroglobus placidus DSM 10642]
MKQKVKLWVRDVEEFFFCPMVFYFSVVLGISKDEGYWAELGKEIQEEAEQVIAKSFEVQAKEFRLESEKLGVVGKADFVVKDGNFLAPLEVKYSSKLKPWWKYSAILYAIMLEEVIKKPVKRAFIYLTEANRIVSVEIRDEDRKFVVESVKNCHEILRGKQPKAKVSKSCENCDYKQMCLEFD